MQEALEVKAQLEEIEGISAVNWLDDAAKHRIVENSFEYEPLEFWENPINEYVFRSYLLPDIPKFMYYDECYVLPSRISLDEPAEAEELTRRIG